MELEDLIAGYTTGPDFFPGFQTYVTGKREFHDLASFPVEPPPQRPGDLYKHQRFIERYMAHVSDVCAIFHKAGSGKTCSYVAVAEYFRKLRSEGGHIKKAYILVKGPALEDEVKRQIVCVCTAGDFITSGIINATELRNRKGAITRSVSTWYRVRTYKTFINKVIRLQMDNSEIIRRYSNCLFVVDEVQNIRSEVKDGEFDPVVPLIDETELRDTYRELNRVFHLILRSKIILASATPMINTAAEIGPILNLILPPEKQFPPNFDYVHATIDQIEPRIRGVVSYVRELETGADPVYQGQRIMGPPVDGVPQPIRVETTNEYGQPMQVQLQTIVYPSRMERFQLNGREMGQDVGYLAALTAPKTQTTFYVRERQASNIVFPDNTFGDAAFHHWVIQEGEDRYRLKPEFLDFLRDPTNPQSVANIRLWSCKYAAIIDRCRIDPGNCFVYSDFKPTGAIMIGLGFEVVGFQKFSEHDSVFISPAGGGGLAPVCSGREDVIGRVIRPSYQTRNPDGSPIFRYALLTSDNVTQFSVILETFNSPENAHGELLKVIIGSPISQTGINLANVLQVHIASAGWNPSSIYQAMSRAIRATSHVVLLDELRQQYIAEGRNPAEARVEVKIYKHVAISTTGDSVDLQMYQQSERKEIEIKRMERMLKEVAIDCQIHRNRNIRPTDIPNTPQCDYQRCDYPCFDPAPTIMDNSTYDVYYSDEEIQRAEQELHELFRENFVLPIDKIYEALEGSQRKFVDIALTRCIEEKRTFFDRYGFMAYLRAEGNQIFLQRDYPIVTAIQQKNQYPLNYYVSNLNAIKPMSLTEQVGLLQEGEQGGLVQQLQNTDPTSPTFDAILNRLNIDSRVHILETAVSNILRTGQRTPVENAIIDRMKGVLFTVHEPRIDIERAAVIYAAKAAGKREAKGKGKKGEQEEYTIQTDTPIVYIHNLYSHDVDQVAYAVVARFNKGEGRIRILNPAQGTGWRDATDYEAGVYSTIIQRELGNRIRPYEQFDIYGTILTDKKFRIRDKYQETENAQEDARTKYRGRECAKWNKPALYDLMWRLRIQPPGTPEDVTDRDTLITYLLQNIKKTDAELQAMPTEQLLFYYRWFRSGIDKTDICTKIQTHLLSLNRVYIA